LKSILRRGTGGRETGEKPGEKRVGDAREAGEEGAGRSKKKGGGGKFRNIAQYSHSKKCKEAGANKYRAGTGIKGYGKREV